LCKRLLDSCTLAQDERTQLLSSLCATNWNKSKAAQQLHWSRVTLYRKMWKYHIINKKDADRDALRS
jgi:two-component system response regulator HydG/two-component system response regulator AtoC